MGISIHDIYVQYMSRTIYYSLEPGIQIRDYYNYILSLIMRVSTELNLNRDVTFVENIMDIPCMRVYLNFEHTLVKQYDENPGFQTGIIEDTSDGSRYLVRIDDILLSKFDIVIDYSMPNMYNVMSSRKFESLYKKMVYIAPSLYRYDRLSYSKYRPYDTMTSFYDTTIPRRAKLLNGMGQNHLNVFDCFDKSTLERIYKYTKIMINIHQTDVHHTFEELRVLPALQCGVIVISEISPLSELVPYGDYVIWCSYDEIVNKVREILGNYESYRSLIFDQPKKIGLNDLNDLNYSNLRDKFLSRTQT
jgi:hypothetical protein